MEIAISPNKMELAKVQKIKINDKIITLVGENGSGKSAILEKVFKDYLDQNEITLVSFTSGQNESFSKIFSNHLIKSKKFLLENNVDADAENENERIRLERERKLNSFYFNTKWAPLLIFFASTIKYDGNTRQFLRDKGYVIESANGRDDLTSVIWFQFKILTKYLRQLADSDRKESLDSSKKSIRKSIVHRILEKLANHYDIYYDFSRPYYTKFKGLSSVNAFRILGKDVNEIFTFLGHALRNNQFILNNTIQLNFAKNLQLNDLSDGEFQLLTIYAIVDLFDSVDTLFLFDEIDSHVHYKNTQKIWDFLKTIQGNLLTTTHSADSIVLHNPDNIRLVHKGRIEEEQTAEHIFLRLQSLTDNNSYIYRVASTFEYIALVENKFDWKVFIALAKRKVPKFNSKINSVRYISCSSGFNNIGENFAIRRKNWVEDFKKTNGDSGVTKAIFFICDRDNLPLNNINEDGVTLNGIGEIPKFRGALKPHPNVWKRREIENYFISATALQAIGQLDTFLNTFQVNIVNGNPNDIEPIRILDVKSFFQQFYLKDGLAKMDTSETGVDENKLLRFIELIPPEEISEDIANMYNFIVSKMI